MLSNRLTTILVCWALTACSNNENNHSVDSSSVATSLPSTSSQSSSMATVKPDIKLTANNLAFAALKPNGDVETWGNANFGGYSEDKDLKNIKAVFALEFGFLAENEQGKIIAWGGYGYSTDIDSDLAKLTNIKQAASGDNSIYAITHDGKFYHSNFGYLLGSGATEIIGRSNSFYVLLDNHDLLNVYDIISGNETPQETNVAKVVVSLHGDYVLKNDGSITYIDDTQKVALYKGINNAVDIVTTHGAVAVLLDTGEVLAFGDSDFGGDTEGVVLEDVSHIYATFGAFAALTNRGNVITWGSQYYGGYSVGAGLHDIQYVVASDKSFSAINSDGYAINWGAQCTNSTVLEKYDIKTIVATSGAYAAITEAGNVVAWGEPRSGGALPSRPIGDITQVVASAGVRGCRHYAALGQNGDVALLAGSGLKAIKPAQPLAQINTIASIGGSFGMIRQSGHALRLGYDDDVIPSPASGRYRALVDLRSDAFMAVDDHNNGIILGDSTGLPANVNNIKNIVSNGFAFAVIKNDDTVEVFGPAEYGGDASALDLTNVASIHATHSAFAALKNDGSVITWGDEKKGGNSESVNLTHVKAIAAFDDAFIALNADGELVAWGDETRLKAFNFAGHYTDIAHIIDGDNFLIAQKEDGTYVQVNAYVNTVSVYTSYFRTEDIQKIILVGARAFALNNDHQLMTWLGNNNYSLTEPLVVAAAIDDIKSVDEALHITRQDGSTYLLGDIPSFIVPNLID